jgi:hypothetical protein
MSTTYPRLRSFFEPDYALTSDTLLIRFYMRRAHQDICAAVMYTLDLFRERVGPHRLGWYYDPDSNLFRLPEEGREGIREQMLGPEEVMILRLSDGRHGIGGFYTQYLGLRVPSPYPERKNIASVLSFWLPTEYLEEQGPARIRALALELAEKLPFNSGYVDLALDYTEASGHPKLVHLVRTRYLGIHYTGGPINPDMNTWVEGVHWMNFLGQPVLGAVGGVAGLRERLKLPGLSIQEMSRERVLLTLGDEPDTGDVEAGRTLPLHRALARVLEPHLYSSAPRRWLEDLEAQCRWERRFLE